MTKMFIRLIFKQFQLQVDIYFSKKQLFQLAERHEQPAINYKVLGKRQLTA